MADSFRTVVVWAGRRAEDCRLFLDETCVQLVTMSTTVEQLAAMVGKSGCEEKPRSTVKLFLKAISPMGPSPSPTSSVL